MSIRSVYFAVPTALVAAVGFAWLTSASAFDGGFDGAPQIAQAAPPAAQPPAAGGGSDQRMRDFSPKAMCEEHIARRIGNRAYIKARLDLKPEQLPAWNTFEKAADEASTKEKAKCASLPTEMNTPADFTTRFNRREEMLKARLDSLEAVKPSLMALYAMLTPEQKALFDRPMGGHRHHHHWNRG
jgi:LTXXQ motif family protein